MERVQPLNTQGEFALQHKATAPLRILLRLGNGTMHEIIVTEVRPEKESEERQVFVAIFTSGGVRFGAFAFGSWAHANYVHEKLGLSRGESGNMADFINWQLKHRGIISEEPGTQGTYDPKLCADYVK
jgi:hypothetical protein